MSTHHASRITHPNLDNHSPPVAIITGASRGIGEATARRFALGGWRVTIVARSADRLEEIAAQLRARDAEVEVVAADLTEPDANARMVAATLERWGRVDLLVNNAGQGIYATIAHVAPEQLESIFRLNVFAPVYGIQAVVPAMRAQGGGTIVNVSSILEKFPLPFMGIYNASKIALSYLSDAARVELARDGIDVINVLPGPTDTPFNDSIYRSEDPSYEITPPGETVRRRAVAIPPSEVAEAIWRAVDEAPRQIVPDPRFRPITALAPLFVDQMVRVLPPLVDRYIPRRGEAATASLARDLTLSAGALGALVAGALLLRAR